MSTPTTVPPPLPTSEDRLWIVLCHLSLFFGVGILLPLIVYLVKKSESTVIAFHARQALNFHISLYLYAIACIPLMLFLIGFPLVIMLVAAAMVFSVVAAVRGADGREYRYPLAIPFVR